MSKLISPQERFDRWWSEFVVQHEVAATEGPILLESLTRFASGEQLKNIKMSDARLADLFDKLVQSYTAEARAYGEERRAAWDEKISADARAGGKLYTRVM